MHPITRRLAALALALVAGWGLLPAAWAQATAAELFKGADLALGSQLIAQHKCNACHAKRAGGDGSAMYRPFERVNTPGELRGMVEQCNLNLNLALFPDEVTAISAVLNRDHYRFK